MVMLSRHAKPMATMQDDDLNRSSLYQAYEDEIHEILKHKWIESEKAGYDIGFDRARTDWSVKHRAGYLRYKRSQRRGKD
jgi:hypothetical protein